MGGLIYVDDDIQRTRWIKQSMRKAAVIDDRRRGRIMPTKDKTTNAIAMLKEDHEKVKNLFERFEETNGEDAEAKMIAKCGLRG